MGNNQDVNLEYDAKCKEFEETLSPEQKEMFYELERLMEDSHNI